MLNGIVMTALPIRTNHDGHNTVMSTPTVLTKGGTPKKKKLQPDSELVFSSLSSYFNRENIAQAKSA